MIKRLSSITKKTLGIWQEGDNLSTQVARSGAVSLIGRLTIKLIQFIKTIILARILFPADFGLFGIAAIVITITDIFLQTGFYQALIHERDKPERLFNTAWTINILRGLTAGFLAFLVAPLLGNFFNAPDAVPLVRGLALAMVIIGFENVGIINFQRHFQFAKKLQLDLSIVVIEIVSVIALAWLGFGVWALVGGSIINRLAAVFLSFYYQPYRPKLSFNFTAAKHLISYGKWITAISMVSFLLSQGDYVVIGKLLGPESLGFYQLAFTLAILPAVEIVRVIGNILFPLYAKIASEAVTLRQTFIRATRLLLVLPVPAALGLIMLRTEIVSVVYGAKWLPMAPILAVLAVFGLFKAFDAAVQPFFLGTGKPKYSTLVSVWQLIFMFAGILPLTYHWGAVGTAASVTLGAIAAVGAELWFLRRQINLGLKGLLEIWLAPFLATMVMGLGLWGVENVALPLNIATLIFYLCFGAGTYFLSLFIYDRFLGRRELWSTWLWFKHHA